MNKVKIVFIGREYEGMDEVLDSSGFEVLCGTPDAEGTIPVRRVSDGLYFCLPAGCLEERVNVLPKVKIAYRIGTAFSDGIVEDHNTGTRIRGNVDLFIPGSKAIPVAHTWGRDTSVEIKVETAADRRAKDIIRNAFRANRVTPAPDLYRRG